MLFAAPNEIETKGLFTSIIITTMITMQADTQTDNMFC